LASGHRTSRLATDTRAERVGGFSGYLQAFGKGLCASGEEGR
jgi:hypothetical protein